MREQVKAAPGWTPESGVKTTEIQGNSSPAGAPSATETITINKANVDAAVKWVSVEPMLEPIMPRNPASFAWYVIGGASRSSGQPGFVPPFAWVARLALAAMDAGSHVFVKSNFWQAGRPQQFPVQEVRP